MKKLRLIKPWKLRAVKQRMQDNAGISNMAYMPCCGPGGNVIERYDVNHAFTVIKVRMGDPYGKRKTTKGPR